MSPSHPSMRINSQAENWSTYHLADGAVIKIKHLVTDIKRQVKPDGQLDFDSQGQPIYRIEGQNVVHIVHSPLAKIPRSPTTNDPVVASASAQTPAVSDPTEDPGTGYTDEPAA